MSRFISTMDKLPNPQTEMTKLHEDLKGASKQAFVEEEQVMDGTVLEIVTWNSQGLDS